MVIFSPHNVWCPAIQKMVAVIGTITPLANGLEELHVKQCVIENECEKTRHGHADCLRKKRLASRKW